MNDAKHVYAFLHFYKSHSNFHSSSYILSPSLRIFFYASPILFYVNRLSSTQTIRSIFDETIHNLPLISVKSSPVIIFKCLLYPDANAQLNYKSRKRFKGYLFSCVAELNELIYTLINKLREEKENSEERFMGNVIITL